LGMVMNRKPAIAGNRTHNRLSTKH
jgi:hypothetical protein